MFTSSPTGSFPPSSPAPPPRVDYPSSPFHTAACVYTCVQPRVESILPSLSLLHLFSTYLRSVFSLLLKLRSTNVSPSSSILGDQTPLLSSFSSVVLQNRGIQMTSDDEYPRLSRPAGNCRYSCPYFCPRLRYSSKVQRSVHAHAVVGSFLPSSFACTPLLTFLPPLGAPLAQCLVPLGI